MTARVLIVFGAVLLLFTIAVVLAVMHPPKEYKGDGKVPKPDVWDESIEDV